MVRIVLLLLVALALAPQAWAGDAKAGKETAKRWCTECHVIETNPPRAVVDAAPPFPLIANDPSKPSSYLRAWLFDPHPPMPKLELSRRDIDDLVRYIESLRAR